MGRVLAGCKVKKHPAFLPAAPTLEPPLKLLGLNYCWKGSTRDSILAGTTSSFLNSEPVVFKDILTNPTILWFAVVFWSLVTWTELFRWSDHMLGAGQIAR